MKANGKLNKQLEEMMRKANRALAAARIHIKTRDMTLSINSRAEPDLSIANERTQEVTYASHTGHL